MKDTTSKSLFNTAKNDEEIKLRLDLLKYLDDRFYANNEYVFFNFLEYTRFINETKSIAYTTRDRMIFLNYTTPNMPNDFDIWEFIYAHECLHQIYDTFGIGDLIVKELGQENYDHYILNVASDCIINETLYRKMNKTMPPSLITANYLYKEYGVSYNMYEDTQFSLYQKIWEIVKKDKEMLEKMLNDSVLSKNVSIHDKSDKNSGTDSSQIDHGQNGQDIKDGQGSTPGGQDIKDGQGSTPGGQDIKDGQGGTPGGQDIKDGQDGQGGTPGGQDGQGSTPGGQNSGKKDNPFSDSKWSGYGDLIDYYNSDPTSTLDELITKAKNTITGPIGEFIEKITNSVKQIRKSKYGMSINSEDGNSTDYMKVLINNIKIKLSNELNTQLRKYEDTYMRLNRRRPTSSDGIINKGRKQIYDKLTIDISFYIDISGSMGKDVDKIFSNLYANTGKIVEQYKKIFSEILEDINFKFYAFNERISPVKKGVIPRSTGGNVDLDEIIKYIHAHTETSLINVIITDAGFTINNAKVIEEAKKMDGSLFILTNNISNWPDYKRIEPLSKKKVIAQYTTSY